VPRITEQANDSWGRAGVGQVMNGCVLAMAPWISTTPSRGCELNGVPTPLPYARRGHPQDGPLIFTGPYRLRRYPFWVTWAATIVPFSTVSVPV
jgi:hypothetical protein